MKTYAVFLFDDAQADARRYTFLRDINTDNPEQFAIDEYCGTEHKLTDDYKKVKTSTWDARITINNIKFASQTVAYIPHNGGKAIVLAERYPKVKFSAMQGGTD